MNVLRAWPPEEFQDSVRMDTQEPTRGTKESSCHNTPISFLW